MSQFVVMHLTPVSKSWTRWMHGIGRCHHPCKKASIKHSSQKKVESPRCPSQNRSNKHCWTERHGRTYALTHKANIIGISASANTTIKCFICDWIFIPKAVGMGNYMDLLCLMSKIYPLTSHDHITKKMINFRSVVIISAPKGVSNFGHTIIKHVHKCK